MTIPTNNAFFDWMLALLHTFEQWRTPVLDALMSTVTWLGSDTVFLLAGLVLFWCLDKKFSYRVLFACLAGTFLNLGLKLAFRIPRPWVIDPSLRIVESAREGASGWSFPSGHTQDAVMLYGALAHRDRRPRAYAAAGVLTALVGFSRMYLGVHTLLDVGAAILLGVATLLLCGLLLNRIGDSVSGYVIASAVLTALCAGLIVLAAFHEDEGGLGGYQDVCSLTGAALGLTLGSAVERRYVRFETKARWWAQILKVALGLALILVVRVVLKSALALISDSPLTNVARYFVMTFTGVALYPLTFRWFAKTKE